MISAEIHSENDIYLIDFNDNSFLSIYRNKFKPIFLVKNNLIFNLCIKHL